MSRLKPLTPEELTPAQREVFDAIASGPRGNMGMVGPFSVYVRAPSVGNAVQGVGAAVRFGTELPNNIKEVAICTVGAHYHSKFEFAAHDKLARQAGVEPAIIDALRANREPEFASEGERLGYEIATELLNGHQIEDATFARGSELLGETQLIELVATVGYYVSVSLTLNAFRVPLAEGMEDPFPNHP